MMLLGAALCFVIALCAFSYFAFKVGYNLGWEERQRDMILPRRILERANKDLDDQETHDRHSAIDPKKPVWH